MKALRKTNKTTINVAVKNIYVIRDKWGKC